MKEIEIVDAYFRAANYLSACQMYLLDNPLLKRKLTLENFKVLAQFLKARNKCKKIIKEFSPDVVIGAGGYVTGPVIWAAKKLGKKREKNLREARSAQQSYSRSEEESLRILKSFLNTFVCGSARCLRQVALARQFISDFLFSLFNFYCLLVFTYTISLVLLLISYRLLNVSSFYQKPYKNY